MVKESNKQQITSLKQGEILTLSEYTPPEKHLLYS